MPDPYAPKGRIRRSNETRDPVVEFRSRLAALGATEDEIDEWIGIRSYADLDDEQRVEFERARHASDDEIRFEIEAVRGGDDEDEEIEEAGEGTVAVGVEGIDPAVDAAAHAAIENEATPETQSTGEIGSITRGPEEEIPPAETVAVDEEPVTLPADLLDENVPEVLAWVDGDPRKAAVVLEMETLADRPRKTLVEPLREIVDGAPG